MNIEEAKSLRVGDVFGTNAWELTVVSRIGDEITYRSKGDASTPARSVSDIAKWGDAVRIIFRAQPEAHDCGRVLGEPVEVLLAFKDDWIRARAFGHHRSGCRMIDFGEGQMQLHPDRVRPIAAQPESPASAFAERNGSSVDDRILRRADSRIERTPLVQMTWEDTGKVINFTVDGVRYVSIAERNEADTKVIAARDAEIASLRLALAALQDPESAKPKRAIDFTVVAGMARR